MSERWQPGGEEIDPVAQALAALVMRPDADDDLLRKFLDGAARESDTLAAARALFGFSEAHYFECRGEACREFAGVHGIGEGSPCALTATACQGHCERAPVGVLRCGDRILHFAEYAGAEEPLARYLRRAGAAGHPWVEDAGARDFEIDPVHGKRDFPLAPVAFLAGHFRGVGHYVKGSARFFKELRGEWCAGRRALALHMAVGFPLRDGRRDQHEALVLIRPEADGSGDPAWVGEAIEDGGGGRQYHYRVDDEGAVVFDDRPPGHGDSATRARKRLIPTETGYLEHLEVERGDGFALYSEVDMRRVAAGGRPPGSAL